MLLLFLTWKHDDCFIPQLDQQLQSSKTPDLKPEDEDSFYSPFDGTPVGWTSDFMTVPTQRLLFK